MDWFRSILVEFYEHWSILAAGWRAPSEVDEEGWIMVSPCDPERTPAQGWKLHVSAGQPFAEEVLRRVLPVLLADDAPFKIAATSMDLFRLNHGLVGLSQAGKFITVYPHNDAQAVRLAIALHQATQGLRGPAVPSDRPLARGSLVHYRYGAFRNEYLQEPGRSPVAAISTPGGEWIEDTRATRFQPPAWATDPFAAAGYGAELPEENPLIGGRYARMAVLQESASGGVFWGIDLAGPRRVILKWARRDAMMEMDGRDARDRLRHEAALLRNLSPDPRFPTPGELVEYDEDLYLVMEDVEGTTLRKYVTELYRQGLTAPDEEVIRWGRELASMLAVLHARGLVYSDLKSTNIIVTPEGSLRLIDFNFTFDSTVENPLGGGDTIGYRPPRKTVPAVTDDVYALGALLYFAATGADPMEALRPQNLLERPIAWLNPALGPGLIQVIERCLAPDADARYQTMAELEGALAAVSSGPASVPGNTSSESHLPVARDVYRQAAQQLGERLCQDARRLTSGKGASPEAIADRNLYQGSAGILMALAAFAAEADAPAFREVTAEMARWLLIPSKLNSAPLAGLYIGEAGRAAAVLRAGQVLGDRDLVALAAARGDWVATQPFDSPDIINGAAGRLRFHLLLWDETQAGTHLQAAVQAGEYLLHAAAETETGLYWPIPKEYKEMAGKIYPGYAHGVAGVGDALLDLYDATGEKRFLQAAHGAARWLTQLALPALEDRSGLNWPFEMGQGPTHIFWCHGAGGIGKFFLHAAGLDLMPGALDIAVRAARTVARGSRWAGPSQCHGLAGNIEYLLDIYQATGDIHYLADSEALARLLLAQIVDPQGLVSWRQDAPDWLSPGYMLGYAGVAACLLRLCDPEQMPDQLSRRGFRYQMDHFLRMPSHGEAQ